MGTIDYMSGISGAGIFAENYSKDRIFLVGIEIQGTKILKQNLVCLDLEKISKKINNALKEIGWEVLKISGAEWKNKFGFDMSDLNFEKEIEEFKEKSKNKFIKVLKDEPLENFINKFDNEVKNNLKKEEEKFQKISESYLYIGMNFHQLQEHKRATHYLNKAIEYGGNKNKSYLLDAKSKREEERTLAQKTEQEKALLLGFINTLYQEMYEYEEQLNSNPNDETLKKRLIECYKELIENLKKFDDRNEEILDIHSKSIKLYANFDEYDNIQEQIDELKDMIQMNQQFEGMKNQVNDYQKEIEKLNKQVEILSTMDKKLDVITSTIKRTNNKKLDNFLDNVYASNKALVHKIQTIYHQNDRVNRNAKVSLENSVKSMNEKLNALLEAKSFLSENTSPYVSNDIETIKEIVNDSNWSFYKGIQGLYEKEHDSYYSKLLEMSIAFTKKENELHIENLEKLHDVKVQKLLEEKKNLVKLMDELAVDYQNSENKSIQKDEEYRELQEKYTRFKERNITSGERLTELDKFRYEEEIVDLNKLIEQLKGKNKQIDELKESITLSSKTANILVDLEKENRGKLEKYIQKIEEKYEELNNDKKSLFSKEFNENLGDIYSAINALSYEPLDKEDFEKIFLELEKLETKLETFGDNMEEKIDEIQKRFNQIKYNPKNEKRLRRIFRQIYGFENKLEEIRKGTNPEITLKLVRADLEKIEKIMKKSRLPVYGFYCILRVVLLGGILLGGLIILFLNEPLTSLIEKLF